MICLHLFKDFFKYPKFIYKKNQGHGLKGLMSSAMNWEKNVFKRNIELYMDIFFENN